MMVGKKLKQVKIALSISLLMSLGIAEFFPGWTAAPSDHPVMLQQLESDPGLSQDSEPKTLKGSINTLKVTAGRSQIVKFAQPIVRISIADPTKAEVIPLAPDQVMVNGKDRGVTSLIVWDEDGQEGVFDLYVENDTSELLRAIEAIAPNEKIEAKVTNDSFILSGQVSNSVILDEIRRTVAGYGYRDDKFIDLTEAPVPQVVLEVKIAEANRSTVRDLRTSFTYRTNSLNATKLGNSFDSGILENILQQNTPTVLPRTPIASMMSNDNVGGITGTLFPATDKFNTAFDFLETKGKIITLAEPSLVCTHGRTADFVAGGEFPYVSSVDSNGSPIISFREFGVKLNFTPWIAIRSGRIELKVSPEVSNIDRSTCQTAAGGTQVCGIAKRTTSTTVELQDGESLMISGILTRDDQRTMQGIPYISNLPIIGPFFANNGINRSDRELIVVVTPRIVKKGDYGHLLGKN